MRRRVRVIAGLAALAFASVGIPGSPAGASKAADTAKQTEFKPYSTGAAKKGGTITFIEGGDINTLDNAKMVTANGNQGPIGDAIYGTLLWYDSTTGKLHSTMADSLTTKDGITWVLKLKPNLKFTDGTPLDAAAVKFNWERYKDPLLGSPARGAANAIAGLTIVDSQTLNIALAKANFSWPTLFGFYALNWIGSPTAIQNLGADWGKKPVGAGPFMIQSYTPGQGAVLVRNPNYYDKALPYLDQINLTVNPDFLQGIATVAAGQAQAVVMSARNGAAQARQQGLGAVALTMGGGPTLTFNTKKAPFNDLTARKAVSLAIDPNVINQSVFNGNDQPALNMFAPGTLYYDKSITLPVNIKGGVNADAQKLFDQYAAANGGPLKFTISRPPAVTASAAAQSIQTQLASYKNVTVALESLDTATYLKKLTSSDFEGIIAGGNGDPEPGLTELLLSNGSNQWGGFSNADIDNVINDARATSDVKARKADYTKLQQLFNENVPVVFTNHLTYGIAFDKKIVGWQLFGQGVPLMDTIGYAKNA
jgi:peptide/nickel transport system substrate-binding protein